MKSSSALRDFGFRYKDEKSVEGMINSTICCIDHWIQNTLNMFSDELSRYERDILRQAIIDDIKEHIK